MYLMASAVILILSMEKILKKILDKKIKKNKRRKDFIKMLLVEIISSTINEKYS